MIPNEDKISISERSDAEYAKADRLVLTLYDIYKKQEEARKKAEENKRSTTSTFICRTSKTNANIG